MDLWTSICDGLVERLSGPLKFRLILQPTVAAVIAIRAGLKDARESRPAYLWEAITNSAERRDLLREGWKHVARLFGLAVVMDVVYQLIVLRRIDFVDSLLVAALLAVVPYLIFRGPTNRIARLGRGKPVAPR